MYTAMVHFEMAESEEMSKENVSNLNKNNGYIKILNLFSFFLISLRPSSLVNTGCPEIQWHYFTSDFYGQK